LRAHQELGCAAQSALLAVITVHTGGCCSAAPWGILRCFSRNTSQYAATCRTIKEPMGHRPSCSWSICIRREKWLL